MKIIVAGIDEVGRGALAGPVIAAAVILKNNISGLNDSKKLSPKKDEALQPIVTETVLATPLVDANEINTDEIAYNACNNV